jgi:hypothetical protein
MKLRERFLQVKNQKRPGGKLLRCTEKKERLKNGKSSASSHNEAQAESTQPSSYSSDMTEEESSLEKEESHQS